MSKRCDTRVDIVGRYFDVILSVDSIGPCVRVLRMPSSHALSFIIQKTIMEL